MFIIQTDGEALFYLQETDKFTDVKVGDSPYCQEQEFYEYFTDGKGKAFYRPETYDVFYPAAEFSDEFNKLCIPLENSLDEEQIDVFHQILNCVSDTAAEMRAAYKVGFKDGVALMREVQK